MGENRSSFTGKLGFVLAAAGSAVGLGNLWRFPYLAAQYGGGIFLLVYIILALTFGYALMTAEIAIGRKTGLSVVGAFQKLNSKYAFIGYIAAIVPIIILPYYSVIGGWVTKYLFAYLSGGAVDAAADGYFGSFITGTWEPLLWFVIYLGATAVVVLMGVEKGIEKVSKIMMPILVVLALGIAIYIMFLDGAWAGIQYYLLPDFTKFSGTTVLAAMGQLFYSMSLAMGIMITYGSYIKKEVSIESSVSQIEWFDTGIAFLAGLVIIPATFAFSGGDPAALGKGPSLMFVALPQVFNTLGAVAGTIIGIVFFVLVLFAALTSSISLMETVVSFFSDKFKWSRKVCCFVVLIISVFLGVPSALGYGIMQIDFHVPGWGFLDFFDFISNSVLMPIVAFMTCIFVAYVLKLKPVVEEVELSGKFKRKGLFVVMIKYLAPICILLILGFSIMEGIGIIKV